MTEVAAAPAVDEAAEITRLAALSPLDYDRARDGVAKKLGVRAETLDGLVVPQRPKPAPEVKPTKAMKRYGNPPKGKHSNTDPTLRQLAAAKAARDAAQKGV